jgi:predicted aldo/keto reductase-like oxidoreductase
VELRKFGKLEYAVSALGFGAMRLPVLNDRSSIDEPNASKMIRYAIDHDVNYLDTAYGYGRGKSEIVVGKALQDGYREKIMLATKLPLRRVEEKSDFDKLLNEQLNKLQTEYLDFYLLHGVRSSNWEKVKDLGLLECAEKAIEDGRIRHIGFSFHDEFPVFKEVIDFYDDWDFCQIQYNYIDTNSSYRGPGTIGLKYAASKGLAVVVMEPIRGGQLAIKPALEIQSIWDEAPIKRTPAEWALKWVWDKPEVSVVLSGMSTMQQVEDNVESAGRSNPGSITSEELNIIHRVKEKYLELGYIGCTSCLYCQPCPHGVAIPDIIKVLNETYTKDMSITVQTYLEEIPEENQASICVQCGTCEENCPQSLPIIKLMRNIERTRSRMS